MVRDPFQNVQDAKEMIKGATGIYYDPQMMEHKNPWDPEHIETPERLRAIWERIQEYGLVDQCVRVPSR